MLQQADSPAADPVVRPAPGFIHAHRDDLLRGLAGLSLIGVAWPVAWRKVKPMSNYYFFPLWSGYILTMDAAVALRTGTSPMRRSGKHVGWLFLTSMPLWWIFEAFNKLVHNWRYHFAKPRSTVEYAIVASVDFSTVIPAVLTTTEMIRSFELQPLKRLPAIKETPGRLIGLHLVGWAMIGATAKWPKRAFPLVWSSLIFLLDPIATKLGGRSIAWHVQRGDWSVVSNMAIGTLVCGFFWEMWNHRSMPKWTYQVPYVGFGRVFEMPIVGYGGYLPFGSEVYIFYVLTDRLTRLLGMDQQVRIPNALVSSQQPVAALPSPVG